MQSGFRSIVMMLAVAAAGVGATSGAVPLFAQEAASAEAKAAIVPPVPAQTRPVVQIAILLDTSNSMDGLIEQAKSQLWKIVNEFAKANRGGQRPEIQVALYHYGTPTLGAETGYIKQLVPLTDDLDKVSEELFKLRTNGGDEYCGAVIKKAVEELKWSAEKGAYKAIFIAGNEPFTQGTVNYSESCKEAIAKGILVNTIFCGEEAEGVREMWKDGAVLADGSYMSINQNAAVVQIDAPQDKELAELGQKINSTYIRYGAAGAAGAANQTLQDSNAASPVAARGGAVAERAVTKASGVYRNSSWDLVDGIRDKQVQLKEVKDEDLPEEMRKLDDKGREAYVAQKQKEREEIQGRIKQLGEQREKYIAEKRKEQGSESTLDTAVVRVVRTQATNNGMTFEK